jgi:flagellar motor switch protein FliN/FliY
VTDVLSADQIAQLVAAAKQGSLPQSAPRKTRKPLQSIPMPSVAASVRMTRALSDRAVEESAPSAVALDGSGLVPATSIRDIRVRVAAELGRLQLPLARAVGLDGGAVLELDRSADDPVDLYVNGRRFATGSLVLIDQTDWAVRIEQVLDPAAAYAASHEGGN